MASIAERLASARRQALHPRMVPTGLEAMLGTRYTYDTIRALGRRFPRVRFVWLMGADNLIQLPRWEAWPDLMRSVPVAIFDRPQYSVVTVRAQAAQRFAAHRLSSRAACRLADEPPPAWGFLPIRRHAASATAIREGRGWPA
jgi:nicotinate-nucleotide adenylyltransferase